MQSDPDSHKHPRFEAKQDGGSGEELEWWTTAEWRCIKEGYYQVFARKRFIWGMEDLLNGVYGVHFWEVWPNLYNVVYSFYKQWAILFFKQRPFIAIL